VKSEKICKDQEAAYRKICKRQQDSPAQGGPFGVVPDPPAQNQLDGSGEDKQRQVREEVEPKSHPNKSLS
jgi:hypothetical protein